MLQERDNLHDPSRWSGSLVASTCGRILSAYLQANWLGARSANTVATSFLPRARTSRSLPPESPVLGFRADLGHQPLGSRGLRRSFGIFLSHNLAFHGYPSIFLSRNAMISSIPCVCSGSSASSIGWRIWSGPRHKKLRRAPTTPIGVVGGKSFSQCLNHTIISAFTLLLPY
jgi:hypothetical protein